MKVEKNYEIVFLSIRWLPLNMTELTSRNSIIIRVKISNYNNATIYQERQNYTQTQNIIPRITSNTQQQENKRNKANNLHFRFKKSLIFTTALVL